MSKRRRPDDQDFILAEHTRIRKAIGDRTVQSVNEIPQFRVQKIVQADELIGYRQKLKASNLDCVPTFNDIIIKLVATVLPEFPRLNAWHSAEGLKQLSDVNIGFAVDTEDGVLLPTVLNADKKSLSEIAQETSEMIDAARRGKLRATLQMGAGFTISNMGPLGIDVFDAIVSPPQTGILAIGSILPKPVAIGDQVMVRNTMWLSLTMDHQSVDGADGGRFVARLAVLIEDPREALSSL